MENLDSIPKRQREVIKYITDHPDDIALLTIRELSEILKINPATIIKACKELGYDGFNDLKKHQRVVYRQKKATGYESMLDKLEAEGSLKKKSPLEDTIKASLLTDLDVLNRTVAKISWSEIVDVVNIIIKSKRTYIVGLEAARSIAVFLAAELRTYIPNVQEVIYGSGYLFDYMRHFEKDDVVIGISFGKCIRQTVNAVKSAQEEGIKTISITDSELSPLYKYSDISLLTASSSNSYFSPFIGAMSISMAILACCAEMKGEEAIEQLKIVKQQWEEARIYYDE
ncbi:MAG: MurR/RpiR family transcriptional regulator [Bacteroidota bacterium]